MTPEKTIEATKKLLLSVKPHYGHLDTHFEKALEYTKREVTDTDRGRLAIQPPAAILHDKVVFADSKPKNHPKQKEIPEKIPLFFDIETDGITQSSEVICVGWWNPETQSYGISYTEAISHEFVPIFQAASFVSGFNSITFDEPRINRQYTCGYHKFHFDLLQYCKSNGIKGGLKEVTSEYNIQRPEDIQYVDGSISLFFSKIFKLTNDKRFLEPLAYYCLWDVYLSACLYKLLTRQGFQVMPPTGAFDQYWIHAFEQEEEFIDHIQRQIISIIKSNKRGPQDITLLNIKSDDNKIHKPPAGYQKFTVCLIPESIKSKEIPAVTTQAIAAPVTAVPVDVVVSGKVKKVYEVPVTLPLASSPTDIPITKSPAVVTQNIVVESSQKVEKQPATPQAKEASLASPQQPYLDSIILNDVEVPDDAVLVLSEKSYEHINKDSVSVTDPGTNTQYHLEISDYLPSSNPLIPYLILKNPITVKGKILKKFRWKDLNKVISYNLNIGSEISFFISPQVTASVSSYKPFKENHLNQAVNTSLYDSVIILTFRSLSIYTVPADKTTSYLTVLHFEDHFGKPRRFVVYRLADFFLLQIYSGDSVRLHQNGNVLCVREIFKLK